jgi:hypothetical protein
MAKSGGKGRYITKVGFYDIYAKDSFKKSQGRGEKMEVSSTEYCLYHSKKLVEKCFKTKDLAVVKAKELLGESFREVYNIK